MIRSFARSLSRPAIVLVAMLASCREVGCPDGQVAVEGVCYLEELVAAAGGGVPIVCTPACTGDTPHCDYRTGTCFACRSDADCADGDAPICDPITRACTGCSDDDACERFDEVCAIADARCVECTLESEARQCGNKTCNLATNECTTTDLRSRNACESCVTDRDCGPSLRCVDYAWRSGDPFERVCLYERSAGGCQSGHGYRLPYASPIMATTVDGTTVEVCAPPTTCFATRRYWEGVGEDPIECASSSDCDGAVFNSAICILAPGENTGRCGIWCAPIGGRAPYTAEPCFENDFCDVLHCVPDPDAVTP